jgi:predicted metalloprotease with PDZ domain
MIATRRLFVIGLLLFLPASAFAQYPCPAARADGQLASTDWSYSIELKDAEQHLVDVTLRITPTTPSLQVQMPVWNALYQVRDFAEHINWIRATDVAGQSVRIRKLDKTTWSAPNASAIEYEIHLADSGPFGAEYSTHHAFLNLAQVLLYPVGHTSGLVQISFSGIRQGWNLATPLARLSSATEETYCADSYDHLVDSPVEISDFRELHFDLGGAHYNVAIDADPDDYDANNLLATLKDIVSTETEWMNDRPFQQYTFIYHLPRGPGRGGMEHAYSTAIETSVGRLAEEPLAFAGVSAHEFFHLWNVKRIRPQSLEPIDYTRENYTRALWFCEGVDSAVSEYMLVRAGLADQKTFLDRLASQIRALETRPAHLTQSVEESSLDAWLEKYPYYRSAERSVNYYNKGMILGVLLDLQMREQSHGAKSLRDLFQWLNQHYAKEGKFYSDSDAIRQAVETVTGADSADFFRRYVTGTDELPYDSFFQTVGLKLQRNKVTTAYAGFSASTNFGPTPIVTAVDAGGEADKAGLRSGDLILAVNGHDPGADFSDEIASLKPGDTVKLKVSTRDRTHDLKIKLTGREDVDFEFVELPETTPQQRFRREAWVRGDSESPAKVH